LPAIRRNKVDMVIMPRPPNCIKTKITPWPKGVKAVPVSTTTSPVTQAADVAVNSASTHPIPGALEAWGRTSKSVPAAIRRANPRIETYAGDLRRCLEKSLIALFMQIL